MTLLDAILQGYHVYRVPDTRVDGRGAGFGAGSGFGSGRGRGAGHGDGSGAGYGFGLGDGGYECRLGDGRWYAAGVWIVREVIR